MVDSDEGELERLRSNAENLSTCLHSLMARIRDLETSKGDPPMSVPNPEFDTSDVQVCSNETITTDPVTGIKKKIIVSERVLTTKTYHLLPAPTITTTCTSFEELSKDKLNKDEVKVFVKQGYSVANRRRVSFPSRRIHELGLDEIEGKIIVTKVVSELCGNVKIGDIIEKVGDVAVTNRNQLLGHEGSLAITLKRADIGDLNSDFIKILQDTDELMVGDIVEVITQDGDAFVGRNINELDRIISIPKQLPFIRTSLILPYTRKCIALVGSRSVGRRSIKSLLLKNYPNLLRTIIPLTSRERKNGEVEGYDYIYETKRKFQERIRNEDMFEFGTFENDLYGSSKKSIRRIIRSGRVPIIDITMNGLKNIYNGEFEPFVVCICAPEKEELEQYHTSIYAAKSEDELSIISKECESFSTNPTYKPFFDTILVNRNHDLTAQRIMDLFENLHTNPTWTPTSWISKGGDFKNKGVLQHAYLK
uniref:Guanylate kinase-like domain-containing protein n=1 Tax=Rhabditophanes sp. KR3021 TaxID=114890 RepID=A0AC35U9Q4_9BILA